MEEKLQVEYMYRQVIPENTSAGLQQMNVKNLNPMSDDLEKDIALL